MDGSGILALTGANTFTGATNVNAGVLEVNGGSALSDSARVTIASGADLAVFGSETVGSVAGSGKLSIFTGSTFTVGNDGTSSTFSGFVGSNGIAVTWTVDARERTAPATVELAGPVRSTPARCRSATAPPTAR